MNAPTHPAIFCWQPAARLRVTGSDAAEFLQGQFTNDLRQASSENAVYGLWLTVKGKVLADSFVSREEAGEVFHLTSYFSPGAVIRERLESYIIADDVVVEDVTDRVAGVTRFGAGSLTALKELRRQVAASTGGDGGEVFAGRRGTEESAEWVFPSAMRDAVSATLAMVSEIDAADVARRRIRAGIPAVPTDVGPGDLPNEAGLESVAISYTKGCYLGQEVMARLKAMGQVRRRLLRVSGRAAEVPPLPAPLFVGSRSVGELRSAVHEVDGTLIGLAMLSLLHVGSGAELAFAADAAPVLRLVDAP